MKPFFSLLAMYFFLLSCAHASGTEAEAGSNLVQGQEISPPTQLHSSSRYSPQHSPRIKRSRLRFQRTKTKKLTKVRNKTLKRSTERTNRFKESVNQTERPSKRSWNKRANLVIIISWAVTVIGFLSFLLSIIGGTPAMFTFGLVAMMLGGAGMLCGLIWGLSGT